MPHDLLSDFQRFRESRDARLRDPSGWLTLVGRWILAPGENSLEVGTATLLENGDVRLVLRSDLAGRAGDSPAREIVWRRADSSEDRFLHAGGLRYELLRQGELAAIRARDPNHPARIGFLGMPAWDFDPAYRVHAHLDSSSGERRIPIVSGLGVTTDYRCPGTLRFELMGRALALDALYDAEPPVHLFLNFRDETCATGESYGAGRFLYAALPDTSGLTVIDFNRAINPPCALTDFAACPLAPMQNWMEVRIEAGEKRFR